MELVSPALALGFFTNSTFWTVMLEKSLESPLDWKEIKQSIQKEINPEYSLEGLMLKLTLQYFGHMMWRADSLEKILMLGKIEGGRRAWQDKMVGQYHWLNGHEFEQTLKDGEGQGSLACSPRSHKVSDTAEGMNSNNHLGSPRGRRISYKGWQSSAQKQGVTCLLEVPLRGRLCFFKSTWMGQACPPGLFKKWW